MCPPYMPRFEASPDYEHGLPESTGVLLVNLGTPSAPTTRAVRKYLAEFLFDPRVVELPRPLWWLILHGYILRTRPAKSAAAYREIWTEQGSPLSLNTMDIAAGIQETLSARLGGAIWMLGRARLPAAAPECHSARRAGRATRRPFSR